MRIKRLLLSVLLIVILGNGSAAMEQRIGSDQYVAARKIVVEIAEGKLDLFFEQVRKFADKNAFAIRIAPTTPTGKNFIVELWREDLKLLGANPFDKNVFQFSVFNISGREIEEKQLEKLTAELGDYVLKIDGSKFSEQSGN